MNKCPGCGCDMKEGELVLIGGGEGTMREHRPDSKQCKDNQISSLKAENENYRQDISCGGQLHMQEVDSLKAQIKKARRDALIKLADEWETEAKKPSHYRELSWERITLVRVVEELRKLAEQDGG